MKPMLEIRDVSKRYGGVRAITGVSFDVAQGEILGLMGANGAGKTTLMSMLAGNVRPTSGEILLDGTRIDGLDAEKVNMAGIARTFQIVRPFANMSVLDNVAAACLYGRRRMRSLHHAREQAQGILDEVGLGDRAELLGSSLTLAGRKRLEVARALATNPRILLLDEVLAGLNASEVNEALEMLGRLHAHYNLTIIIIEHVMKALMRLSHRIVVLHDGQKVMEGSPDEVVNDERVIKAYLGEGRFAQPA